MSVDRIFVVIIRTPNSDRSLVIEDLLKNDSRFEIRYIEASMTPNFSDVTRMNIDYSTKVFEYFWGRKLTPAEIGCADSHNKARKLIQDKPNGGVILEDDARIFDIDSFFTTVEYFLKNNRTNLSVLNLTGYRKLNLELVKVNSNNKSKYIRLLGKPDLAVSYALTKPAAFELLNSNSPITTVADWPVSKCNYFVPLIPIVIHGDSNSRSFIDYDEKNFRVSKNLKSKLFDFTFISYVLKKESSIKLGLYITYVYKDRICWYLDYIRMKWLKR
jgi:GR25 family glycosyltransferase involved in LPS biosynthesis